MEQGKEIFTWNWFSACRILDIDELFEENRMFSVVPITQDYGELFVVGMYFPGWMKQEGGT